MPGGRVIYLPSPWVLLRIHPIFHRTIFESEYDTTFLSGWVVFPSSVRHCSTVTRITNNTITNIFEFIFKVFWNVLSKDLRKDWIESTNENCCQYQTSLLSHINQNILKQQLWSFSCDVIEGLFFYCHEKENERGSTGQTTTARIVTAQY